MGDKTAIEWTDATWNPVTGCTKVSPGCDHCYAEKITERFHGKGSFAEVKLHPDRLDMPLRWRKPRRVFVNSMSDLFHDDIPDEYIARVFAVMAQTPQHTYQILTKRHGRMRSLLNRWTPVTGVPPFVFTGPWPLPNVWLGVSVENQQWAKVRIPALLETPAAVRFISAEPLLGAVDLSTWIPPRTPVRPEDAPDTWAEWTWPDWVPSAVADAIEDFWSERIGRGPAAWLGSARYQNPPAFGATVTLRDGFGGNAGLVTGRFVHAWNNIGRLVMDDGSFRYTSFDWKDGRPALDWVIVGGESGPGARPMHPLWARQLRDQCGDAGVPFLFKQRGEWTWNEPGEFHMPTKPYSDRVAVMHGAGMTALTKSNPFNPFERGHPHWGTRIERVGKKAAGRELDGRTWDEFPAVTP